jgi:hypothetical protein
MARWLCVGLVGSLVGCLPGRLRRSASVPVAGFACKCPLRHAAGAPLVACRLSHVACRLSHVACRLSHVACRLSHVACRLSHVACRTFPSPASCLLHSACRTPSIRRPLQRCNAAAARCATCCFCWGTLGTHMGYSGYSHGCSCAVRDLPALADRWKGGLSAACRECLAQSGYAGADLSGVGPSPGADVAAVSRVPGRGCGLVAVCRTCIRRWCVQGLHHVPPPYC